MFKAQARIQHPRSREESEHQDYSGVNGLRFFCARPDMSRNQVLPMFEFTGSIGDWVEAIGCPEGRFVKHIWVEEPTNRELVDKLGVTNIRLLCGNTAGELGPAGVETRSESHGVHVSYFNKGEEHLICGSGFIEAVGVRWEEEAPQMAFGDGGDPVDNVGITAVQYTCQYYGKLQYLPHTCFQNS